MFRGRHEHTIDAKGRTSLPARFREVLAKRARVEAEPAEPKQELVVTTAFDACLDVYTLEDWQAFEEALAQKPQFDDRLKALRRHYVGNAQECELDKLGRLLLPSELRAWAGLDSKLLWVGVGKRIEVWNPERFAAENAVDLAKPESFADMKARMTELGL